MTLDQYLSLPGSPTNAEFGAKCNPQLSGASVGRIRKGQQNISRQVMIGIIEASGGLVSADGLVRAA